MSGGYVRKQKAGEHQMVTFHFIGELDPAHVKAWNDAIYNLKQTFKGSLSGVTMPGDPTPPEYRKGKK